MTVSVQKNTTLEPAMKLDDCRASAYESNTNG